MPTLRSLSVPVLPLLLAAATAAQAIPAPAPLLDRLGLRRGTVQPLAAPLELGTPFELRVVLDGRPRVLAVRPYEMRAPDFALLSLDEGRVTELPAPPSATYRGTVQGVPGSIAALTVVDGQLVGTVLLGERTFAIQPASDAMIGLPYEAHVVYRHDDVDGLGFVCGVTADAPRAAGETAAGEPDGLPAVAELAVQIELPLIQVFGSVQAAVNRVTGVLNSVDAIYQRDCGITYTITRIVTGGDPYPGPTPGAVLSQFQSLWNARARGPEFRRDLAQLFSGFPRTSTLGIANLATVCNTSSAYSVCWLSSSFSFHVATSAHEMGHSWSASHCSGPGCRIMCAALGGCSGIITSFGSQSIQRIVFFRNSRSCLN